MNTSSKTLSSVTAKTVLARKRILPIIGVCIFLALIISVVVYVVRQPFAEPKQATLGGKTYHLTVARAPDGRPAENVSHADKHGYYLHPAYDDLVQQKGLGGFASIPRDSGMIFWYTQEDTRCFWMKDMRFSLDIIWVDDAKQVVHTESAVPPATYPKTFCADKTRYVVELNAGEIKRAGITAGQTLAF